MTTLHLCFRASKIAGRGGTLFFRISHKRKFATIATTYHIQPHEWDSAARRIALANATLTRRAVLRLIDADIEAMRERIGEAVARANEKDGECSAADIAAYYRSHPATGGSLFELMREEAERLQKAGRHSSERHYTATRRSVMRFAGGKDLMIEEVTPEWVKAYEAYLLGERGVARNSSSFYLRCLRAIYNRGVRRGLVEDAAPFGEVYTGVEKTAKRALTAGELRRMQQVEADSPAKERARDFFMLSYCLRGMAFVDLAKLRTSDLRDGILTYRRSKTGQQLAIRWTPPMQALVEKYAKEAQGDYLLPIIRHPEKDWYGQYVSEAARCNRALRQMGKKMCLPQPLTFYCARHSWSSIAYHKGVDIGLISDALGHENVKTTRIYLDSINADRLHDVNDEMIGEVVLVSCEET